jgi:hypothetical protein
VEFRQPVLVRKTLPQLLLGMGLVFPILSSAQQANVLTARKAAAPPVMDGKAEAVWQALPALSFKAVGGRNFPKRHPHRGDRAEAGSRQRPRRSVQRPEKGVFGGVALFDNTQVRHAFSTGVFRLSRPLSRT